MVKGSDPEEFVFITVDHEAGQMKHMSEPFSEEGMRKHLSDNGMPKAEIDEKIATGREKAI